MNRSVHRMIVLAALITLFCRADTVLACGSCYGAADSSSTAGMNFAILSMIGVTGGVLAAMSSFFFYLRKRALLSVASETEHQTNDDGGNH